MTKILIILIIALALEAVGVVLLSSGLKEVDRKLLKDVEIGKVQPTLIPKAIHSIGLGLRDWRVVLGVVFEAIFFGALMYLLSQRDVSVVWPLTALGFVVTTLAAKYYLKEEITGLRWAGVGLIIMGAALITWSEKIKGTTETPAIASTKPRL
ncbi:MAG: DMT family transporter [Verrucomicrobia bacterium]|nr:DMT family transporter [Verrucomicrobiota bacterium]